MPDNEPSAQESSADPQGEAAVTPAAPATSAQDATSEGASASDAAMLAAQRPADTEPGAAVAATAVEPSVPASSPGHSESRPWVDEVPEPVTPAAQRVSETVKAADLPPVEQLRGRVLANRYLAEEIEDKSPGSVSYRAYHLALDRAVSVRILPRGLACSDELCQEVRRVAQATTEIASPHIVASLDFGVLSDGWPFVVTEYHEGRTLANVLAEDGKFVLRRVLHVAQHLALGLSQAHEAGFAHGLLRPDNVLIVEPGTPAEVVKILGFGVLSARGPEPEPPRSGVFAIPFYVSPEQAACQPFDGRADIYALGIMMYEMITGAPPFVDGDFASVLCQHLDDDAALASSRLTSPGALAKALDAIVQRCLQKDPARRYASAADLAEDLNRLEAAASRSKRRPMRAVERPTATIHSPAKSSGSASSPGAKVIVEAAASDVPGVDVTLPGGDVRASAPAVVARVDPPVRSSPPRISVDQATIKISAVDLRLAAQLRPGNGRTSSKRANLARVANSLLIRLRTGLALVAAWCRRLLAAAKRHS